MNDCLFCKIALGKLKANVLFDDPEIMAFHDINPQAPTHILVIPKKHIATINDTDSTDEQMLGRLILTAKQLSRDMGFSETGYRLVLNVNKNGGQEVDHIHLHLIGGRQMNWPPG